MNPLQKVVQGLKQNLLRQNDFHSQNVYRIHINVHFELRFSAHFLNVSLHKVFLFIFFIKDTRLY